MDPAPPEAATATATTGGHKTSSRRDKKENRIGDFLASFRYPGGLPRALLGRQEATRDDDDDDDDDDNDGDD